MAIRFAGDNAITRASKKAMGVLLSAALASPSFMCGVLPATAAASDNARQTQNAEQTTEQETVKSLNEAWSGDAPTISEAGTYRLDADLEVSVPLTVSLTAGASATVDLNGHNITVIGEQNCAVDARGCKGNLSIVDSQCDDSDAGDAACSSITLLSQNVTTTIATVRFSQEEQLEQACTLSLKNVDVRAAVQSIDAKNATDGKVCAYGLYVASKKSAAKSGERANASIESCSFSVVTSQDDAAGDDAFKWAGVDEKTSADAGKAGAACAICSDEMPVSLAGEYGSALASTAGTCDLYAFGKGLFSFEKSFTSPKDGLRAFAFGAGDGELFAQCASKAQTRELAASISCAAGEGSFIASGKKLIYCEAEKDAENLSADSATKSLMAAKSKKKTKTKAKGKSLNSLWKNKGLSYAITKAGTYYLDSDLELTDNGVLSVAAEKGNVTIDLKGHTIKSHTNSERGVSINVASAKKLTIKNGSIECSNSQVFNAINLRSETTKTTLSNLKISCSIASEFRSFNSPAFHVLEVGGGTVNVKGCVFSIDESGMLFSAGTKSSDTPACIYVKSDSALKALNISKTKLSTKSSTELTTGKNSSYWGGGVTAYGLYSAKNAPITMADCSVDVSAPHATAFGISASKITLTGTTTVNVNGEAKAIGVQSLVAKGVALNGKLTVGYEGDAKPKVRTALYSDTQQAFVIGKSFAGKSLGAYVGAEGYENIEGTVIAGFASKVSVAKQKKAAGAFMGANGATNACNVSLESKKLVFAVDEQHAMVETKAADGTVAKHSSATAAANLAQQGDTIRLLSDADKAVFSADTQGKTLTLDLNGYKLGTLVHSDSSNLQVMSLGGASSIDASHVANQAIEQSGEGKLTVSGVRLINKSSLHQCTGANVSGAGALELKNCSIEVSSEYSESVGVNTESGSEGDVTLAECSIKAYTQGTGLAAYGLRDQASRGTVTMTDTPISLEVVDGMVGGVNTSRSAVISGSSAQSQSISVNTLDCASSAWGISGNSASANLTLNNVAVSLTADEGTDTSSAEYWCLASGTASNLIPAIWTLSGACSFSSCNGTDILEGSSPVTLAGGFELAGDDAATIKSDIISGNCMASCQGDASEYASKFKAAPGSFYSDGWSLAANGSQLVWQRANVAQNTTTSTGYPSLQEALAKAKSGETLKVTSDVNTSYPLTVNKGVAIDLQGHTVSVNTVAQGSAAAINCTGKDAVSITNGTLKLYLGSKDDSKKKKTEGYRGIATAASEFSITNASVDVSYAGSFASQAAFSLYGVYQSGGVCNIGNGVKLAVNSSASRDGQHAQFLYGAFTASGTSMDVAKGASITVNNQAQYYIDGEIKTEGIGNGSLGDLVLERIDPPHDGALYKKICELFQQSAVLDDEVTTSTYNARVYYAYELMLEDGTFVWAYSKPVPIGSEGAKSCIPDLMFIQSKYAVLPTAYGVSSSTTAMVPVSIGGTVSTTSPNGDAMAVNAQGSGKWTVDGASLSAKCGDSIVPRADKQIDLRDFYDLSDVNSSKAIFYPERATALQLKNTNQRAYGINVESTASLTVNGALSISTSGGDAVDIVGQELTAGQDLAAGEGQTLSLGTQEGNNSAGTVAVAAEEGQVNTAAFSDAYGQYNLQAADDGTAVWGELYTVDFCNGEQVIKSYEDLEQGATVSLPDPDLLQRPDQLNKSYTFIGWSTSKDATSPEIDANTGSVEVDASVKYYAVYAEAPVNIQCVFENLRDSSGKKQPSTSISCQVNATIATGSSGVVPTQSDYTRNGSTYRFVGWEVKASGVLDPQDVATSLVMDYNTMGVTSGKVTFTAVYVKVDASEHLVIFKNDDALTYSVMNDGDVPVYADSAGALYMNPRKDHVETGYSYDFAGWHTGRLDTSQVGDATADYAAGQALPEVTEDVTYTACFNKELYTTFLQAMYWQKVGDTYKYAESGLISLPYGSDPVSEMEKLVKVGDTFTQNGTDYVFLGWSLRKDDIDPPYTDSLPASTSTDFKYDPVTYYGIYGEANQKVTVTFHVNGEVYATADGTATTSVKDAFASTGKETPANKSDSESFLGWATKADSTKVNAPLVSKLGGLSGGASALDLYAVYGSGFTPTVSFVDSDHETTLGSVTVENNGTVAASGGKAPYPTSEGQFFKGWVTSSGDAFDLENTTVTQNIRVYADYKKLTSNVQDGLNAEVKLSDAYMSSNKTINKNNVFFDLNAVDKADATLSKKIKAAGDALITDAVFSGYFRINSAKQSSASSFGSVTISLPVGTVSKTANVCVYWLDANGNVRHSSVSKPSDGMVTFTLESYSYNDAGNIAVAQVSNAKKATLNGGKGSGAKPAGGGGKASIAAASGGATLSKKNGTGAKSSTRTADADEAENASAGGTDANQVAADAEDLAVGDAAQDGAIDEEAVKFASLSIAGNPLIWLIFLLIMALLCFGAYRLFVAGKREEDSEEGEPGWSDGASAAQPAAVQASAGGIDL